MFLLAGLALAAPLGPTGLLGRGVEVSAFTGGQTARLREPGCAGDGCLAWRADTLVGGEVGVGLAKPIGLYAHGAWVRETMDAAQYQADGYAFGGGLRGAVPLGDLAGVHGWVGLEHQLTAGDDLTERASAWQLDGGLVLRGGRPDEGLQAWVGVGFVPWSTQSATVLDGAVDLTLAPQLPAEGVAGVMLSSDALFGPWDDRTRLAAGVTGTVGYRTGITGFVSLLY